MNRNASLILLAFVLAVAGGWYFRSGAEESAPTEDSRKTASALVSGGSTTAKLATSPPGLSAAVAVAAEKQRIEALAASLRADDYCAVSSMLEGAHEKGRLEAFFPPEMRYRALAAAAGGIHDGDPCLYNPMASSREDLLGLTEGKDSDACKFVRGAVLSGQWELGHEAMDVTPEQRRQGSEILRGLAARDPGNGIFSLFYLGALEDGREQDMMNAYQDFLRATHFTDPVQGPLEKNLQGFSRVGPAAWLVASAVGSMGGSANYMRASGRAVAFAKQGLYPDDFEQFVRRLTEQLAEVDRGPPRLPYMNLLSDAVLNGVAKSGRKFLRAEANAGAKYLDQKSWMAYYRRRTFMDSKLLGAESEGCEEMAALARKAYPNYAF